MNTKQKQIERENQIAAAAIEFAKMCNDRNPDLYDISAHDLIKLSFIAGAKIADKFPRRGLVKIEDVRAIYRMWCHDDNDHSTFPNYFDKYCDKEGWL